MGGKLGLRRKLRVVEVCGHRPVMYGLASELRPPGRFTVSVLLSVIGLGSVAVVNMGKVGMCRFLLGESVKWKNEIWSGVS